MLKKIEITYTQYTIESTPEEQEILIAQLVDVGFEGFEETDTALHACITNKQLFETKEEIKALLEQKIYTTELIKNKNWNEEWEKSFEPVTVDDKIIVRATFHIPQPQYEYEIIIQPKMSFGTGHHATTEQMMRMMLELTFEDKKVFDFGCGTGILSILASKLKADYVYAIDCEDWTIDNAKDNATVNECNNVQFDYSTLIEVTNCDIVLANINKNVLVEYGGKISETIVNKGFLLTSGYYSNDAETIEKIYEINGFIKIKNTVKDEWNCHLFQKL